MDFIDADTAASGEGETKVRRTPGGFFGGKRAAAGFSDRAGSGVGPKGRVVWLSPPPIN